MSQDNFIYCYFTVSVCNYLFSSSFKEDNVTQADIIDLKLSVIANIPEQRDNNDNEVSENRGANNKDVNAYESEIVVNDDSDESVGNMKEVHDNLKDGYNDYKDVADLNDDGIQCDIPLPTIAGITKSPTNKQGGLKVTNLPEISSSHLNMDYNNPNFLVKLLIHWSLMNMNKENKWQLLMRSRLVRDFEQSLVMLLLMLSWMLYIVETY